MSRLELFLLGPPRLERDGVRIDISRRKATALLAYLATTRQSHSRDALATLLWPDADQRHARAALRRVLSDLNQTLGEFWLESTADSVALNANAPVWVDVEAFHALWEDCQSHGHPVDQACAACGLLLTRAVDLFSDDFLAGFTLPDAILFDEWQFFQAESLRRELAGALEQLVYFCTDGRDFGAAIAHARRWSALDPLSEPPHHHLMQLYAQIGYRTAALRQYEVFTRSLRKELGADPGSEIVALYEHIRRGDTGRTPASVPVPSAEPANYKVDEEMRPVTVLFVGLSGAAGASWELPPGETANSLSILHQTVTQVVSEYGARIDRFVGDGVRAVFGTPQVHEDDPERAVRTALMVHETLRELRLSVSTGVSSGRVYFGRTGAPEPQEIMAIGPVVDLAARLQGKATSGQILVSAATYRYSLRTFDFIPVSVESDGTDEPVTAYQVMGFLHSSEQRRALGSMHSRLIGRDEEMRQLTAALDAALHGQGQVVSLIGEAGVGSSRLIAELKQAAQAAGESILSLWLESHCLELHMRTSFWPFIDMLQAYLSRCHAEEPDYPRRLIATLSDMVRQGDLLRMKSDEVAVLLGNLLGIRFGTDLDERLKNTGPEQMRHRTILAIYDFLSALARRQPLVLVFDELQWADDLSLDMLSVLLEILPSTPLLLLCAYRPEWPRMGPRLADMASQRCPGHHTELRLRELTPVQSRSLVESTLLGDRDLPDPLVNLILERARGNPFFLKEAVRSLIDSGAIFHAEGRWQTGPKIEAAPVPEGVQSVIQNWVERLEPDAKLVLRSAAVIGQTFPVRLLAKITPRSIDLPQALMFLEEVGLIYREPVAGELQYSFRHVLIQEAVYKINSQRQRASLHGKVAEAMTECYSDRISDYYEQLAYHYDNSDLIEKAIGYLLKVAEKSRRAYLNSAAIRYFRTALERLDELSPTTETASGDRLQWKLAALTGLGQIYHELGVEKAEEAENCLRQAIEVGQEAGVRARTFVRLYYWLGEVLFWQERYAEQVRLGEAGLALLRADEAESVEAALMNQTVAVGHQAQGDHELFRVLTERTAQFIQRLPYSEELRPAYIHILGLYFNKDAGEAGRWLQIVERLAEQHSDLRALAEVHDDRWLSVFQSGDLQGATSHFARILELYAQIGDNGRIWRSLGSMTWNYLMLGDLPQAQLHAQRGLAIAQALSVDRILSESYLIMGMVLLGQRSWQEARAAFEDALDWVSKVDHYWTKCAATYCLGRLDLIEGKPQASLSRFQATLALFTPSVYLDWWLKGWSFFAGALSGLEEIIGVPGDFRAFCRSFEGQKMRSAALPLPRQWCLEADEGAARSSSPRKVYIRDAFRESPLADWIWQDPFSDCSYKVESGLEIHAANGRDLWWMNRSAPRLVRQASGDFAIQTFCRSAQAGRGSAGDPGHDPQLPIGGLLLWKDDANFLRLVLGSRGTRDVSFEGYIENQSVWIGRGLLPTSNDRPRASGETVGLRLERSGSQVRALCSINGEQWFGLGRAAFPVSDPVQVGIHAVGWIDRIIYPGAHSDGTAICFTSFEMWGW